jgi:hypothetical protein
MNALEQVTLAGQAAWLTLRRMGDGRLWAPWLALGAVQAAVLLCLAGFAHPWLAWALAPLVRAGAGESALHYPGFFRALPALYARADLVVTALAGAAIAGWSTALFAGRWRGAPASPGAAWVEVAPRMVTLVLVQLPFNVLAFVLSAGIGRLLEGRGGMALRLGGMAGLGAMVLLQALFLYLPALVVLERRGLRGAFAALPRTWARGFWAGFVLGAVALLPLLPFDALSQRVDLLVDRGAPELTAGLTALQLVAGLVVSFLLAGGSTLVYLGSVAETMEDAP